MDVIFLKKILHNSRFLRALGLLLALGLVGAVLYSATLVELLRMVFGREGSSHGVFIPLLSLYFIWRKRSQLGAIEPKYEIGLGLVVVAGGLLLSAIARSHSYFYWDCVSFIVVLAGFVILFSGMEVAREILFPTFFLISMIPIPEAVYSVIADWSRHATMEASAAILAVTGVPFLRDGLLIHLPNISLSVNIGCSGIRYLLSYFVFGIAYAYFFRTRLTSRGLVIGLTIPISLVASTLRLTIIALLACYIGPHMARYWPHVITSWLIFFTVLVFFVAFDRWLVSKREKMEKVIEYAA